MCIIVTEDAKKKAYMDTAKKAGLKEQQWGPTADLVWKIRTANATGEKKSILVRIVERFYANVVGFDIYAFVLQCRPIIARC